MLGIHAGAFASTLGFNKFYTVLFLYGCLGFVLFLVVVKFCYCLPSN